MRSRHLILPTLGLIANLRGRAFIFMAEVPFATFPLFWYFAVSYVVDRANLLSQLEPAPPTCGLVMRFVMTCALCCRTGGDTQRLSLGQGPPANSGSCPTCHRTQSSSH